MRVELGRKTVCQFIELPQLLSHMSVWGQKSQMRQDHNSPPLCLLVCRINLLVGGLKPSNPGQQ